VFELPHGHEANPFNGNRDGRIEGLRLEAISKPQHPNFGSHTLNRLQRQK
jgi:hypothetical protein